MNDNAKKWIEALRSGEYRQGRSALCRDGGYCCLGVACAIYVDEVGDITVEKENVMGHYDLSYDGERHYLPNKVRDWLGLNNVAGRYDSVNDFSLSALNDEGYNFRKIAQIIKSEPRGLFKS